MALYGRSQIETIIYFHIYMVGEPENKANSDIPQSFNKVRSELGKKAA